MYQAAMVLYGCHFSDISAICFSVGSSGKFSIIATPFLTPKGDEKVLKKRVDINDLLSRVRDEKKKANKVNLIFFGLFTSLVFIVGVILSF